MGAAAVPIRLCAKTSLEAEVVIVGSGPAGIALADRLTASGISVLVVETGLFAAASANQALGTVLDGGGSPYELSRAGQRVVGGSSSVWGGICPRLHAADFVTRSRYGYGTDWPIPYEQLARYYCQAEWWLGVSGGADRCKSGLPSPHDVAAVALLKQLATLGIEQAAPARIASSLQGLNAPLRIGPQRIPGLLRRTTFRLLSGTTARRILFDDSGRSCGLAIATLRGDEYRVNGRVFVLAAGAIQNPRLLMLSDTAGKRGGVGNEGGHLGRWFMEHPNLHYWLKPRQNFIPDRFAAAQTQVNMWYDRLKSQGLGSVQGWVSAFRRLPARGVAFAQPAETVMLEALCEQEPFYGNAISLRVDSVDHFGDPLPQLAYRRTERDDATIHKAAEVLEALIGELADEFTMQPVSAGSHHLMGTTRMGRTATEGVVDMNLKVHGVPNLYVVGSSVFVTGGAANPTLSIAALSLRLADHLRAIRRG